MRVRWAACALVCAAATSARAESSRPYAPERGGVVVAVTTSTVAEDDRARSLAAALVRQGIESFVAHEMNQPPRDADRRVIRGRWRLEDAQRLRRRRREAEAAQAADQAVALFASAASERAHLDWLVAALVERGTLAVLAEDPATAETVFLEAIALRPDYEPDPEVYPQDARRLFSQVRRASRQLRFAELTIEAPALPEATVEVDFGGPRKPPYSTKLAEGRHFVSVSAPGRHPVVVPVVLRAERQHRVTMLPPPSGDARARLSAVRDLDASRAETVAALGAAAGTRFVLGAALTSSQVELTLMDGRTGDRVPEGAVTLSAQPAAPELDAAVGQLRNAILLRAPDAFDRPDEGGWYSSWWGITLIGVVVAGAAAGAAVAITQSGGDTTYRFEP